LDNDLKDRRPSFPRTLTEHPGVCAHQPKEPPCPGESPGQPAIQETLQKGSSMSDEDKLFALILAMLVSGEVHHNDCVKSAQRILKQIKEAT
jgi:hypothetical protein